MNLMKKRQKNINLKVHKITMKKLKRQVKGITLIALVVTVIVLLILAGVAISLTVGDNGLFRRAQNATDTWQEASEREAIELAVAGMQIGSMQETGMTKQELENSLKEQFGDEASVEDNEDGSFLVTIGENKYYVGEDGEIIDSSNMVKISTAEELKAFRDDVNSGNTYEGKYVYLTNDITLDSSEEWEPIGKAEQTIGLEIDDKRHTPFKGIFDGNKHSIKSININTTNKGQGLFGLVVGGTIKNLSIGESIIKGGAAVGGIVGYMRNDGTITNCSSNSTVSGTSFVAGIVGFCNKNCYISYNENKGIINNTGDYTGGIVGNFGNNSDIFRCHNSGTITGTRFVGGIIGSGSTNANISEVYNDGEITGSTDKKGDGTGGIAGRIYNNVNINNSYNTGNVSSEGSNSKVGGIVGYLNQGTIINCYNIGEITGNTNGPIFGNSIGENNTISNCFSLGDSFNYENLGNAFKEDTNNINNGYPIFTWQ